MSEWHFSASVYNSIVRMREDWSSYLCFAEGWNIPTGDYLSQRADGITKRGSIYLVYKKFFKLWNKEYRDGIKTRGNKIGVALSILKLLNDVTEVFCRPLCLLITQALYCHLRGYIK